MLSHVLILLFFLPKNCLFVRLPHFFFFFGGWEDEGEVGAHCENQTSLEHGTFLLSQPPSSWEFKCVCHTWLKVVF